MKKMVITPNQDSERKELEQKLNTPPPEAEAKPEQKENPYPALKIEETLIKPEQLKPWENLSLAATANSPQEINNLILEIETHRGNIPPQGLLLSAKALADAGDMDKATLYLLVAQLRLEFDTNRWPGTKDPQQTKTEDLNAKKSSDQTLPTSTTKTIDNPHAYTQSLSATISPEIFEWVIKDPQKLKALLEQAKEWDAASPYAYKTGYKVTESVPFEDWQNLLIETRESYFVRMNSLQQALEKYSKQK
ncbi:MAG TPA: hypothetical protein PLE43_01100 [Alphaproteobacteria bacterium]|nr:hypothetical protein [Micavibrio sp.]HRK97053.1 hypothetical protein [Alphaproteobacteria bacterium]